ncbi:MAG: glycosyltransferase family 4 protein [Magnetococcus sp. THC-1_WYH]
MPDGLFPPFTRPLRVGFITEPLENPGGMSLAALRHLRLVAPEIELVPLVIEPPGPSDQGLGVVLPFTVEERQGFRIFADELSTRSRSHRNQDYIYGQKIAWLASQEKLDVLHVFGAFGNNALMAATAALECDIPLMISFRGGDLDVHLFGNYASQLQLAINAATLCVCLNHGASRRLSSLFGAKVIHTIRNHVHTDAFVAEVEIVLPRGKPIVGCFGRFRQITGFEQLLAAFDLSADHHEAFLLLGGEIHPKEIQWLEPKLEQMRHPRRVLHLGHIPHREVLATMRVCDLLVFPSIADASPNKVLEGMLARRAIAASKVGGIVEMIRHDQEGVLFNPYDTAEIAGIISALLADPEKRKRLGEAAFRRVTTHFNRDRERRDWLAAYGQVAFKKNSISHGVGGEMND